MTDRPPPADSPQASDEPARGRPDLVQHRDEATPATEVAADRSPEQLLVRTEVHRDEEVNDVLFGRRELSGLQSPSRDDQGRPVHQPTAILAEGLDTSESGWTHVGVPDVLAVSAADAAQQAQGDLVSYPGIDPDWHDRTAVSYTHLT